MRFLIEIIFCIGAAYGIGWFFSSYYARRSEAFDRPDGDREKHRTRALTLVPAGERNSLQPGSAVSIRPVRGRKWLS